MSDDIPMTDFSALEREGRSDVERSALRRAGEFCRVIIDMQAAELTSLRQRVADMTRALERQTEVLNAASVLKSVGGQFDDPLQVRAWTMLGKALDDYYASRQAAKGE